MRLRKFQLGIRAPFTARFQDQFKIVHVTLLVENFFTFCSCPKTLQEAEIKDNALVNVAEEISR